MTETGPLLVDCGPHGKRASAVVCKHLLQPYIEPSGFVENSDDPNDLQAWCGKCEKVFLLEGDMTDAFRQFNGMVIVCVVCYADAKAFHLLPVN